MSFKPMSLWIVFLSLSFCILTSCFHPPFNNFQPDQKRLRQTTFGFIYGAGVGGMIGAMTGSITAGVGGAAVGALIGSSVGYNQTTKTKIIKELQLQDVQVVQYGDIMTLIVPTDKFFLFNSPKISDLCYPTLLNIVRLIKSYRCVCPIYVAAFTDKVGSKYHKRMLTQSRAEAMLTFLWANDIPAQRMSAEGYEDKYTVGDNKLIRGSAYNRRIEIQWLLSCSNLPQRSAPIMSMK